MEQSILRWGRTDWQTTEPVHVGLNFTRTMTHGEVVLLRGCRPAVEERRPRAHRLEPLERIVVRKYLEWHGHEVRTELGDCPHNRQALQFSGWVRLFSLVQGLRSAADDALLAVPNLCQDSTEACSGGVSVKAKCLAKVWEGRDRTRGQQCLELVEGVLAVLTPVEDRVFLG